MGHPDLPRPSATTGPQTPDSLLAGQGPKPGSELATSPATSPNSCQIPGPGLQDIKLAKSHGLVLGREGGCRASVRALFTVRRCAGPGKVPNEPSGLCSAPPRPELCPLGLRDSHVAAPSSRRPGPAFTAQVLAHSTLGLCAFGPSLGTQGESATLRQWLPVASQTPTCVDPTIALLP